MTNGRIHRSRWAWLLLLLFADLAMRLWALRGVPLDSDEPQHLHVVWAWSRGLVPYRDVFDNHTPLFHLLYAPLLGWLGERADILLWMRYAMLPLALGCAWITARLAERLWDRRVAIASVLFATAVSPYLATSIQFRADALWALLWIAAVAVACSGVWSTRRGAWSGLLVGAAFATSLKTTMLLAGFVYAGIAVYAAMPRERRPAVWRSLPAGAVAFTGALAVPAVVVAIVAAKGGFAAMVYCVIEHNLMPISGGHPGGIWRMAAAFPALVAMFTIMRGAIRGADDPVLAMRRALVIGSAAAYLLLMHGFWPLWTRQDLLPVVPLLAIGAAAACLRPLRVPDARKGVWVSVVAVACALVGISSSLYRHPPARNDLSEYRAGLADVLATTRDGDPVMDDKGASIYRRRPFYFGSKISPWPGSGRGRSPTISRGA